MCFFFVDPRVLRFPIMVNPAAMLGIITVYLLLVLKIGPEFMKNRPAYKLERIIQVYNAIQVLACIYVVQQTIQHCYLQGYNILCEPVDFSTAYRPMKITEIVYVYFAIKVIDLLDTVFFVLRKKQTQVSFLHVYHHAGMVILVWHGCKYFPGGHSIFIGAINSFVHVVMYSYYFLTSLNPEYRKNIWWKKYITQIQLIQFFLISLHYAILLFQPNCKFPKWVVGVLMPQNFFMFVLFGDFYYKNYIKKASDKKIKGR